MLKIKHHSLEASINPIGAELSSLRNDGSELIWHGDASFWNGRAPILFPIVGALKDGKMTHNGQAYEMPRHGIARRATFKCIEHTDATLCMSLKADNTTLAVYPWQFELQVTFSLSDSGIEICYVVLNHDENDLLFTIGSHPAFALKIDNNHQFEDYAIGFNKAESFASYALDDEGLKRITQHDGLMSLILGGAHEVTGTGLKSLHKSSVTRLNIGLRNLMQDEDLEMLQGMDQLQCLRLTDGEFSNDSVEKLRQALPGCEVIVR